ncbi:NAD(P)-dependent dehydrogenase (short-subunit alcohol dehydrogenase family) [Bradyrhizobium japonicum]
MKRALCTGVSGSIGLAIATHFLERFPNVELTGTYKSDPRDAQALSRFRQFVLCKLDLSNPASWGISADFDYLINAAGLSSGKARLGDVSPQELDELIAVNLKAPFLLVQRMLPHMQSQGFGRIVNINSIWGLRGSERNGAYIVTKHGMSGLTKAIAKDYAKFGVTANEVCPGPVESRMMDSLILRLAGERGSTTEEIGAALRSGVNSGSFSTPEQIAQMALFLCEDQAAQINGASFVVDGGITA